MNDTAALQTVEAAPASVTPLRRSESPPDVRTGPLSLGQMMRVAQSLAASGYFANVKSPDQAFAKILYGNEIGIGPMAAIAGVHIVDGKPTLDASLVASRIKASGRYDYEILRMEDDGCEIAFFERGRRLGTSKFDKEDATRAGLLGKQNWRTYPRDMYRSRAITRGARSYCPDVFNGAVYTPDEIKDGEIPLPPSDAVEPRNVTPREIVVPAVVDYAAMDRKGLNRAAFLASGFDPKKIGQPEMTALLADIATVLATEIPQSLPKVSDETMRAYLAVKTRAQDAPPAARDTDTAAAAETRSEAKSEGKAPGLSAFAVRLAAIGMRDDDEELQAIVAEISGADGGEIVYSWRDVASPAKLEKIVSAAESLAASALDGAP